MNIPAAPQPAPQGQGHPPARHRAPEVGSWLRLFLAFFLDLAGLLPRPTTPEGRAAARALRELQELLQRYERGELTPADRRPLGRHAPDLRPRPPRSQRRIQLVPGIYAALHFTPRAAIAARARFAAAEPGVAAALRARSHTPVSNFGHSAALPIHALFVPIS
jgi:hypothetical protein